MAQPPPIDYRQVAVQDARKYGVPAPVFVRQIQQESGFDPAAHSSAGADGIAQFIPGTAKHYGVNTRDPVSSLDGAARMDADLIHQYGSVARALSAYNSGRPDAYKDPGFAGGQTYNYVRSILGGLSSTRPGAVAAPGVSAPGVPSGGVDNRRRLLLALAGSVGEKQPDYTPLLTQLLARRQAPPTATPNLQSAAPEPAALPSGRGRIVGDTTGEQPSFLAALAALAGYEHAPVQINSGYRSTARQAQLYANRASNPNPVAPPGRSLHEQGLAADGTVGGKPLGTLPAALLARYGLQPVPGDPVHVQMRR